MTETLTTQASSTKTSQVPAHVAIIMDGNGRWAKQRGLPRLVGHRAGTNNIREIVKTFADAGVKYLTLYAFSTENWGRPKDEVMGLFGILESVIDREMKALHEAGVRICLLGTLDGMSEKLNNKVCYALKLTENNAGITLNLAFNYGGRAEIVEAVRKIVSEGVPPEAITEELISQRLYTADMPDPDLIIRTAGEMRLSNFLIWQAAYSEYYFTHVFWPSFSTEHVKEALLAYSQRHRRFGGIGPE